jgi:hypothetical protein
MMNKASNSDPVTRSSFEIRTPDGQKQMFLRPHALELEFAKHTISRAGISLISRLHQVETQLRTPGPFGREAGLSFRAPGSFFAIPADVTPYSVNYESNASLDEGRITEQEASPPELFDALVVVDHSGNEVNRLDHKGLKIGRTRLELMTLDGTVFPFFEFWTTDPDVPNHYTWMSNTWLQVGTVISNVDGGQTISADSKGLLFRHVDPLAGTQKPQSESKHTVAAGTEATKFVADGGTGLKAIFDKDGLVLRNDREGITTWISDGEAIFLYRTGAILVSYAGVVFYNADFEPTAFLHLNGLRTGGFSQEETIQLRDRIGDSLNRLSTTDS